MGRPIRNDAAGNWHHVTNRGARHGAIFLDDEDRGHFCRLIGGIRKRYEIETHSYCLMGNHYHLMLHCPSAGLSAAMAYLSGCYTRSFNERHGFDGPLFKGRFTSRDIESDQQLLDASRYIHRNPLDIDAHIALAEYRWSSYGAYLGSSIPQPWLETRLLAKMAGTPRTYHRFVEARRPADKLRAKPTDLSAVGNEIAPVRAAPTLRQIESISANAAGCTVEDLLDSKTRVMNLPRLLTIVVAMDDCSINPAELTERLGIGRSGLRSSLARARELTLAGGPLHQLREETTALLATIGPSH
ncbi:MAG: transposase [Acidimicrobiales bacterium]